MEHTDLADEVAQLRKENADLRERFDQLDPQKQAEAMPYLKLLGIVMHFSNVSDIEVPFERLETMPQDLVVVFGGPSSIEKALRVRLMSLADSERVAKEMG